MRFSDERETYITLILGNLALNTVMLACCGIISVYKFIMKIFMRNTSLELIIFLKKMSNLIMLIY